MDETVQNLIESYRDALSDGDYGAEWPLWVKMVVMLFHDSPVPTWIKLVQPNDKYVMLHVNPAYTEAFGIETLDYEDKEDSSFWGIQLTREFHEEDHHVATTGEFIFTSNYIPNRETGELELWCGWKWPIMVDNRVAAVAGAISLAKKGFGRGRQR